MIISDPSNGPTIPFAIPSIPDLSVRRVQDTHDYPTLMALLNVCNQEDSLDSVVTIEAIERLYPPDSLNAQLIEASGRLIGVCRSQWFSLRDGTQVYGHALQVHPNWRGHGLRRALVSYNEHMLRLLAKQHQHEQQYSADSHAVLAFLPAVADHQIDLEEILREADYRPIRYFYAMTRSLLEVLPHAPLPSGLEVREAQPDQYRTIYAAHKEAFREHFGSTPLSEADYQRWLKRNPDPSLWRVAWDGDQVAGMALNTIDEAENTAMQRQRGYCEAISVRQLWRQRGLARALLAQSLQLFHKHGMTEAALTVDTNNPSGALHLYESLGFRVVRRNAIYNKPLLFPE